MPGLRCRCLCLMVAALVGLSGANRNCPDLVVDSCLCAAERFKGPDRQTVRIKVVCSGGELVETLQPSLLPNRTVSLPNEYVGVPAVQISNHPAFGSFAAADFEGTLGTSNCL
uniref:Uncharacterized protein n=1 Tax=Sphaerodactylus townsendi TaxID=933632 RepID=A0ACB8F8R3_9SAUR